MLHKVFYNWEQLDNDVQKIIKEIKQRRWTVDCIYAIPRGGLILGTMLSYLLDVPLYTDLQELRNNYDSLSIKQMRNIIMVDDLVDSGDTFLNLDYNADNFRTITLHKKECSKYEPDFYCNKCKEDEWIVFPWESKDSKMTRDGTVK